MNEERFLQEFQNRALEGPRRLAIDVGANVGEWSRWMSLHFKQVVSIEPDPRAADQFRSCGVPVDCCFLPVACGAEPGVQDYYVREHSQQSSLLPEHPIGAGDQTPAVTTGVTPISVVTLDQVAQLFGHMTVDFVKIDVEGSEADVLKGIRSTAFRKARFLIEIHDRKREVGQELERLGYSNIRIKNHPLASAHPHHLWIFVPPLESE